MRVGVSAKRETGTRLKCNRRLFGRLFHRLPPLSLRHPPPGPVGLPVPSGRSIPPREVTEGSSVGTALRFRDGEWRTARTSQTGRLQAAASCPSPPALQTHGTLSLPPQLFSRLLQHWWVLQGASKCFQFTSSLPAAGCLPWTPG